MDDNSSGKAGVSNDANPVTPSVQTTEMPTNTEPKPASSPKSGSKLLKMTKKKLMIVVFAVLILAGGGAAAYIGLIQNNPANIWKKSLSNTSNGLKTLLDEAKASPTEAFKMDGRFRLDKPTVVDGTFSLEGDEKNSKMNLDVGLSGVRVAADFRLITAEGAKQPDVYANVTGLATVASLAGPEYASLASQVEGQWFVLDHTFLEQFGGASASSSSVVPEITPEEANEILSKVHGVMAERLFTADKTKATFVVKENVGKEDFEGTPSYKFKVGVQKQQLKDFATAMKDALKETKFKDMLLGTMPGKTFEEALDFEGLMKEIDGANLDGTAEVWASTDGHFIRNIRFYGKDNVKNYIDIGVEKLGDEVPVYIRLTGDDETGKGVMKLTTTYNRKTMAAKVDATAKGTFDGSELDMTFSLNVTPSSGEVKVEKPAGAKNVMELFGELFAGFGGSTVPTGGDESLSSEALFQLCLESIDAGTPLPAECQ